MSSMRIQQWMEFQRDNWSGDECGECGSNQQLLPIVGTFGTTGIICDSCYRELILESAEVMPMDCDQ